MIEFFKSNDARYSAGDIYKCMCEAGMKINLVTVYRNLDKLSEERVISKRKMPGDDEYFYRYRKPELDCEDHLHLYCVRCGKLIHLSSASMRKIRSELFDNYGFSIGCKDSMLAGLCGECSSIEHRRQAKTRKTAESEHKFIEVPYERNDH